MESETEFTRVEGVGGLTLEEEAIIRSFLSVGGQFSADRVIVDPELNERFVLACRDAGLTMPTADLNCRLLNIRKKGHLPRTGRCTATYFSDEEDYRFAAEIAARVLQRRDGYALDAILCDPELCRELDGLAQEIAPGFSSLQYRWAALNLRKSKKLSPEILGRVIQSETVLSFRIEGLSSEAIPTSQGLYVFYDLPRTLYVGEASNLRSRLKKHLDHSDNRGLARWFWEHGITGALLEIHVLPCDTPVAHRRALETELIRSRNPLFNVKR